MEILPSATATQTSQPTSSLLYEWEGSWTTFFGMETGTTTSANLSIMVNGLDLSGLASWGNSSMAFEGRISEAGRVVDGRWQSSSASGDFLWYRVNDNQFSGNTNDDFAYCGARDGAPMPVPCLRSLEVDQ